MRAKPKRCREKAPGCEGSFFPRSSFQVVCGNLACAIQKTEHDRAKAAAKEKTAAAKLKKEWRDAHKSIKALCLDARRNAFNPYVLVRDKGEPCISCGRHDKPSFHAGHFMSVGSRPELQFHPDNCHKQCSGCNQQQTAAPVVHKYRANLVAKIGLDRVEYLENYHAETHWLPSEIADIKAHFRALKRELLK